MPAVMRIIGWKSEGLRCPDHEINCLDASGKPHTVTLVQMPNGTGKTTTLQLLRAALSGAALEGAWDRDTIRRFRKKNGDGQVGYFEVRLLLNDRRATIRMEFDFESDRLYYKTTFGPGQREGFHPPADFRRFMSENFVNFFVFDGELAQHLLDREFTDAESVVENLFQISSFKVLSRRVGEYWENKTQHVGATEERGLNRRRNRLIALRQRLSTLTAERDSLLKEKTSCTERLKAKQETYNHEIMKEEARSEELSAAETAAERFQAKVREEALNVLETMRDPHALASAFAQSMLDLKTGLDRVKLPESAAREFFEELADEDECVCGRSIDDEIRGIIRTRAGQYLGSDDVAFLNSMKSAIQDAVGTSVSSASKALDHKMTELVVSIGEERTAKNDVEALRLAAEQSDPAVKRAREEINELSEKLSCLEDELEKFESKDVSQGDERTFGIGVIKDRIKNAEDKLAEVTKTIELKSKRDILVRILGNAHAMASEEISKEICADANERIRDLMPHNNILIDRIDKSLMLQGQEGGSVGETLSVAWGFLATLFHRSEHELPFVVDSPAGSIDLAVRPKIGELIPRLTGQFIAFTISSERERFVPALKAASNDEVQFITLFRKGPTELEDRARAADGARETFDGWNVYDEEFFEQFQLDSEEAA